MSDGTSSQGGGVLNVGVNALFLLPGEVGGSEPYTRRLLDAIAARGDVALTIFTNRENHASFSGFDRIPVPVTARSRPRRILAEQWTLPLAARKAGIDVLFSPGYTAPLGCSVPTVTAVFDVQFKAVPEGFSVFSRIMHQCLAGGAARRATAVVTLSAFGKGEVAERLQVPAERIFVTAPGPGLDSEGDFPRPIAEPYLLTIANSYRHKNLERLGRAFALIADSIPHMLVVIGQPRGGEPPAHPRIRRIHRCSEAEAAGYLRHCDGFVFPSRYEGFGLPVLEALMAGARLTASRIPPVIEIAGDAAIYFDPESERDMARAMVEAVHEAPAKRSAAVSAGRLRAAGYSWAACAEATVRVLREATERV